MIVISTGPAGLSVTYGDKTGSLTWEQVRSEICRRSGLDTTSNKITIHRKAGGWYQVTIGENPVAVFDVCTQQLVELVLGAQPPKLNEQCHDCGTRFDLGPQKRGEYVVCGGCLAICTPLGELVEANTLPPKMRVALFEGIMQAREAMRERGPELLH